MSYLELLLSVLSSSLVTAIATSWLNRRKTKTEMAVMVNEMASRLIDDQREEIDALNGHIMKLQAANQQLKEQIENLSLENKKLQKMLNEQEAKNQRRKIESERLNSKVTALIKGRGLS